MTHSLTRWLATVLLVVGALQSSAAKAQVIMSFSDEDPTYPIGVEAEEDKPASPSASDAPVESPLKEAPAMPKVAADSGGCAIDTSELGSCDTCYVPRNWISTDYLLWWTKGNQLPSLLTTSPAGTAQAVAGVLPGATTLFGAGQIDNEARNGLRATFGHWADDEGTVGWQASYFGVFDDTNTGNLATGTTGGLGGGLGAPILARPFFNTVLGGEDSRLISFPGVVDGNISINSSSEMHSLSWLLRQHWKSGSKGRIDLLGGYRYFRFREGLLIRESLVTTDPAGLLPLGTTFDIEDRFLAENDFHGGDMGFLAEFWSGGLSVEVLAKVALGNLRRSADIYGSTVADPPPAGGGVTTNGGLLALPTNIGHRSSNDFAALPEFGVNVKFEATRALTFNLGYTLLMLNDVTRTGELIDRQVNPTQLSGGALVGAANPASQFGNETDFWAQGLNFGVTFSR